MELLSNGLGAATGHILALAAPLYVLGTGRTWYVDSQTGSDANTGEHEHQAFAGLDAAHTAASNGDIIALADGHEESLSITITKSVAIVGLGRASGVPTVILRNSAAADPAITIDTTKVVVEGVLFEHDDDQGPLSTELVLLASGASDFVGRDLHFNCKGMASGESFEYFYGMRLAADLASTNVLLDSCKWNSVGTGQPLAAYPGLYVDDDGTGKLGTLRLVNCSFDGGEYGWFNYGADILRFTGLVEIYGASLLRGSDVLVSDTAAGRIAVGTATGGSQIRFDTTPVPS
jgi:hypothetical protein